MISKKLPDNWPAMSDVVADDPIAVLYWNRTATEMDKRGHLMSCDGLLIETFAVTCAMRDMLKVEASNCQPEFRDTYQELLDEYPDRLSDMLDQMLLPPNFADHLEKRRAGKG